LTPHLISEERQQQKKTKMEKTFF